MINNLCKLVWIFVYILFIFNIRADVKLPKGLGPVAIESNYIVERGEVVEIKLSATIKNGVDLFEFSIFDMPKNGSLFTVEGTLIENKIISAIGKSVILRYAPNKNKANFDEFTYRARLKGGKYSSPSKIGINIIDPKVRFSTMETLSFGSHVINEFVTKDLNVKNDSSQRISISLSKLKKFSYLNGVDSIDLKPNQIGRIPIILRDNEIIGSVREKLILNSGNVSKTVMLVANVIRPFVVNSKEVILEQANETSSRSSKFTISNNLEKSIKVSLSQKHSGLLIFRNKINLSRGTSETVEVKLNDSYLGDFNSELLITYGKYTKSLKVTANALPPIVIINNSNKFIASEISQGKASIFEIPLTNVGGQPVEVSIKLGEGFNLINLESEKLNLLPEDEKIIQLSYSPKDIGVINSSVGFQWGNVESFITFRVKVKKKTERQSFSSNKLGNKKMDLLNVSADNLLPEIEQKRNVSMDVPVVKDVKLIKRWKKKIEIFWEEKDPGKLKYIVETRVHRLNQEHKMLQFHWIQLEDEYLIMTKNESGIKALIKGLSPGGRYTFRVISRSNDNKFSVPSKSFQFSTIESFDLNQRFVLNSIGLIAGIFLLGFYGVKYFRERRM